MGIRVQMPDGKTAEFPDGMDPAHIQAEIESHPSVAGMMPGTGQPDEHPAVSMRPRSLSSAVLGDSLEPDTKPVDALARPGQIATNVLKRGAKSITEPLLNAAENGVEPMTTESLRSATTSPITTFRNTRRTQGTERALTNAAGDLLAAEVGGKAVEAGVPLAGDLANATGRTLKKAGSISSRVGIGAPAPDEVLDADAGRALSENRVVGASAKGLKRKVSDLIGPATDARNAILDRSTALPTDVTPAVTDPFSKIAADKTNPRTGAVQPASIQRLTRSRKAITQIADPESGLPGDDKDLALTPREMADLQRNVYSMTDYSDVANDLSNQGLQGAAAGLRDTIRRVAPESATATDQIHNLLGAEDVLKSQIQPTELSKSGLIKSTLKGTRRLVGTGVGAGLDLAGSALMDVGGALRHGPMGSPVAPPSNQVVPTGGGGPTPRRLTSGPGGEPNVDWTDIPEDAERLPGRGRGQIGSPVAPPRLPSSAGPSSFTPPSPSPPLNEATARNRTVPLPPTGEVLPPRRKLVAGPNGEVRPEGLPLESTTGRGAPSTRPSLINRLIRETKAAATPAPVREPDAPPASASAPSRLPDPDDVSGWEKLVDNGHAQYNVRTHSYEYTGPITRTGKKVTK